MGSSSPNFRGENLKRYLSCHHLDIPMQPFTYNNTIKIHNSCGGKYTPRQPKDDTGFCWATKNPTKKSTTSFAASSGSVHSSTSCVVRPVLWLLTARQAAGQLAETMGNPGGRWENRNKSHTYIAAISYYSHTPIWRQKKHVRNWFFGVYWHSTICYLWMRDMQFLHLNVQILNPTYFRFEFSHCLYIFFQTIEGQKNNIEFTGESVGWLRNHADLRWKDEAEKAKASWPLSIGRKIYPNDTHIIWVFPKIGKHPNMDGENNGKPY